MSLHHTERRRRLSDWIYEKREHEGLTVSEIADVSGLYSGIYASYDRYDTCRRDLLHLKKWDLVKCEGRPSRWYSR